jgi:hypothetical protein
MQFTTEEEKLGSIAFLDVTVYRKNDKLGHKVFRKPTHTDEYLKFHSHHHHSQKISVIDSLLTRALRISDKDSLSNELEHVKTVLLRNGYPNQLISTRLRICNTRLKSGPPKTPQEPIVPVPRICLPFMGNVTNQISRTLKKKGNFNSAFKPGRKIESFFNSHKDKREKRNKGVVYEINCQNCPQSYVGQTKRDVEIRMKEHLADIKYARTEKSAVASHIWLSDGAHQIQKDNIKVIEEEPRWYHRNFKEALWIQKTGTQAMNQDGGWKINPVWSSLIIPFLSKSKST